MRLSKRKFSLDGESRAIIQAAVADLDRQIREQQLMRDRLNALLVERHAVPKMVEFEGLIFKLGVVS